MFKFLTKKLYQEINTLKGRIKIMDVELGIIRSQIMELNLKRPVVISSTAPSAGSSITVTTKPTPKKRGRPFGSKNKPKPAVKAKKKK